MNFKKEQPASLRPKVSLSLTRKLFYCSSSKIFIIQS
jgi:hypothetical protein